MTASIEQLDPSPWPHRLAVALECVTFPLIWVGGLVTTYDAGMAVPDWPNTYGYNLFAYPWQTWLFGPWGLFIEHGHRLLGALAGMLTIALVVAAWRCQRDPLVRWLSIATLAAVIFQGSLGGLRVIEDQVQMARVHGCVGPAFFALTVAMDVVTSKSWRRKSVPGSVSLAKVERYAVLTTLLAYCQLVLGSFLRHLPAGADPDDFRVALVFHLGVAAALLVHVVLLATEVFRKHLKESSLAAPTARLVVLVVLEICLGAGTWVVKYGWPSWLSDYRFAANFTVAAESRAQAWTTTAHVAMGSLLLVTALVVALRSARLAWQGSHHAPPSDTLVLEAAR